MKKNKGKQRGSELGAQHHPCANKKTGLGLMWFSWLGLQPTALRGPHHKNASLRLGTSMHTRTHKPAFRWASRAARSSHNASPLFWAFFRANPWSIWTQPSFGWQPIFPRGLQPCFQAFLGHTVTSYGTPCPIPLTAQSPYYFGALISIQ